jgi:hypothetical protein
MCEECDQPGTLHQSYAAKKARMARFWTPKRPYQASAVTPSGGKSETATELKPKASD